MHSKHKIRVRYTTIQQGFSLKSISKSQKTYYLDESVRKRTDIIVVFRIFLPMQSV